MKKKLFILLSLVGISIFIFGCMPMIEINTEIIKEKPTETPFSYEKGDLENAWSVKPLVCLEGTEPSNSTDPFRGYYSFGQNTKATKNPGGGPEIFVINKRDVVSVFIDPWGNESLGVIYVCNQNQCGYTHKSGMWCIP